MGSKSEVDSESFIDFLSVAKLLNLTHWGQVTHTVYASVQYANIGLDNGLSPVGRRAIIWTNAAIDPKEHISVKF